MEKLTFTRFVAAMSVVLTHFGRGMPVIDEVPLSYLLRQGTFAVSYFFVLSGFIMAAVYWDIEDRADRRAYWAARFARIYPVYLLALVFMMGLGTENGPAPLATFLLNATMVQAWLPAFAMTGNPPGWSLSTEAFFYLLFPFVMPLLRRMAAGRVLMAIGLVWLVSQAGFLAGLGALEAHASERLHNLLHYVPLMHVNSFLVGIAANLVLRERGWQHVAVQPRTGVPLLVVLASSALIAAAFILIGRGIRFGGTPVSADNGLLAPLFAVFIAALAVDASPATRWLRWAPLVVLGEISYAVYMLQDPVREAAYRIGLGVLALPAVTMFWSFVAALLALSAVVWRWYEVPLRQRLRQRLAGATAARSRTAPVV